MTNYKPLLGLLILAVPVALIWFLMWKSKMPRAEDNDHERSWHKNNDGSGLG